VFVSNANAAILAGGHGYAGCTGSFEITPVLRQEFENTSNIGFDKTWRIRRNRRRRILKIEYVKVIGTCCWETEDMHGNIEEFGIFEERWPRFEYIYKIRSKECN